MGVNFAFTIKEDHKLGVFVNRVLRRIFGRKRESDRRGSIICTVHITLLR
jgi:hypothetical protein